MGVWAGRKILVGVPETRMVRIAAVVLGAAAVGACGAAPVDGDGAVAASSTPADGRIPGAKAFVSELLATEPSEADRALFGNADVAVGACALDTDQTLERAAILDLRPR